MVDPPNQVRGGVGQNARDVRPATDAGELRANGSSGTGNAGNGVTGAAAILPDGQRAALGNSPRDLGGSGRGHGRASFTTCQSERREHHRNHTGGSGSRRDGYASLG